MTYIEQLETEQWKKIRNEVLLRDSNKCQHCYNLNLVKDASESYISSLTRIEYINDLNKNAFVLSNSLNSEELYHIYVSQQEINFLNTNVILYSKKTSNQKEVILGIRHLTPVEISVFNKYKKIHQITMENFTKNSFDIFSIKNDYLNALQKNKLNKISELNSKKINEKFSDFSWKYIRGLHIHHKYYIKNFKAWEYDLDALITLCFDCHENLHKNEIINVYNSSLQLTGNYNYCKRCHGAGRFPEFSHIQSGICFRCNGERYEELIK